MMQGRRIQDRKMSYSELMDINDYISMAEHSFGSRISGAQRIGIIHDLDDVISRLDRTLSLHSELSGTLTPLEQRAEHCRDIFQDLFNCALSSN